MAEKTIQTCFQTEVRSKRLALSTGWSEQWLRRCALSGSDLNIKFRTILLISIGILYTCINRHVETPEKQQKQKQCSTSSDMVVIIYCYIGCKDKACT